MSQLGIVLTPFGQIPGAPPWEIGYSYGGNGTYLCPPDPFFNTRGEEGFYYDTQLGAPSSAWKRLKRKLGLGRSIPTDADLQSRYGYVPTINGEVAFKEGFQPSTWIPPNGWNPAGAYGPQFQPLAGLGEADPSNIDVLPTVGRKSVDWLLVLTAASTIAVTISATMNIVGHLRRR